MKLLPITYFDSLKSYLSNRQFKVRVNETRSNLFPTPGEVPQGRVLCPLFYLLYTVDIPTDDNTHIGTFADDSIILESHEDQATASTFLQNHLNLIEPWLHKWRIKIKEAKSTYVIFSLKTVRCPPVSLNNEAIT